MTGRRILFAVAGGDDRPLERVRFRRSRQFRCGRAGPRTGVRRGRPVPCGPAGCAGWRTRSRRAAGLSPRLRTRARDDNLRQAYHDYYLQRVIRGGDGDCRNHRFGARLRLAHMNGGKQCGSAAAKRRSGSRFPRRVPCVRRSLCVCWPWAAGSSHGVPATLNRCGTDPVEQFFGFRQLPTGTHQNDRRGVAARRT